MIRMTQIELRFRSCVCCTCFAIQSVLSLQFSAQGGRLGEGDCGPLLPSHSLRYP